MPLLVNETPVIPAPFVDITITKEVAGDGTNLGLLYQITLTGTLLASPPGADPVEAEARLGVLLEKQAALTTLFNQPGRVIEFYSPDGSGLTKCNPILKSINFAEGIWVDRTDYTIVLEAYNLFEGNAPTNFVSDVVDTWQIEEAGYTVDNDLTVKPVWRLTRNIAAKGRLLYDETGVLTIQPWQRARTWVLDRANSVVFPFNGVSELNIDASQGYNHTRVESIDIVQAGFSVTDTWIFAYNQTALEEFNIALRNTPDDTVSTTITISGTIRGLSPGLNRLQDRITNAKNYFNTLVKPNLFTRVNTAFPDSGLNPYGSTGNVDYQYHEGIITYSFDFNDRQGGETYYDTYTVSKKTSMDSREISVTVTGTINGRLNVDEINTNLLKYTRAKAYFDSINNNAFMLARAKLSGVNDLKPAYISTGVDQNFSEGSISYTYEFNNRVDNKVKNDYTIESTDTREDGKSTISISGTITGLKESESDPVAIKYTNAKDFFQTWVLQMPSIAASHDPTIDLNPNPARRSRGDNPYNGIITYAYEYNTDPVPTIPNALSQNIQINDSKGGDVFASIPIIGRSAGPVLQDIGTIKEKSKTLTLDVIMKPGSPRPNSDGVVANYKPNATQVFVDRDEENWNETTFRLTRTVTWIYQ